MYANIPRTGLPGLPSKPVSGERHRKNVDGIRGGSAASVDAGTSARLAPGLRQTLDTLSAPGVKPHTSPAARETLGKTAQVTVSSATVSALSRTSGLPRVSSYSCTPTSVPRRFFFQSFVSLLRSERSVNLRASRVVREAG